MSSWSGYRRLADNNGIIDENYVQKKSLRHYHVVRPAMGESTTGGKNISQMSSRSDAAISSADADIHFGVDRPKTVDRLLDTCGVVAIEFTKNIER